MGRIIVWLVMLIGGAALGLLLDHLIAEKVFIGTGFHYISFVMGCLLMFLVIKISKNTGKTLAKYGRKGNLKRMETNILVKQGAYQYMRHPMHLGLLFFPFSFACLMGSPSFIFLIAPAELIFMLLMIKFREEPEAIRKFGNEYIEYKNQRPWFCFKPICLKELLK